MRGYILRMMVSAASLVVLLAVPGAASADSFTLNSDPIDAITFASGTSLVDLGTGIGEVTLTDFTVVFSSSDTAALADFGGKAGTHFPTLVLDLDKSGTPLLEDTFTNTFEVGFDTTTDATGATRYAATFAYQKLSETFLGTGGGTTGGGGTGTGVPEPSSLMLLASGGLALCAAARKRTVR